METEVFGRKRKILIFAVALFGAFLLWMYAIGYDTEISSEEFGGIQVEINGVNTNGYTVADAENFSRSIDIRASGTRSALNDVSAGDFRAYVDISSVTGPGYTTLPITVVAPNGLTVEIISAPNVTLYVDTFTSKTLNILIEKTYSSEYEIGEIKQDLYAVSIFGPESIIRTAEAYSSFALGTITANTVNVSGEILLRDSETKATISNPYITMSNSTVDVTFVMYGSKTVPVELILQGGTYLPSEVLFATSEPSVTLMGPLPELAEIDSLQITCDETLLEEKLIRTVTVGDLLASNQLDELITVANPAAEFTYTVEIPSIRTETIVVPVSRIFVYGLPEDGSVSAVAAQEVQVTVIGTASAIKNFDDELLTIMVNYETLTKHVTGNYYGIAEISTGDSRICVDDSAYTVLVAVTELAEQSLING